MKKLLSMVLFVVLVAASCGSLIGCVEKKYTITYNIEGLEYVEADHPDFVFKPERTKYSISREYYDLWLPEFPSDYTFKGWFESETRLGWPIDGIPPATKGNIEFFGKVYRNSGYSITYIIDDVDRTSEATTKTYTHVDKATALWMPQPSETNPDYEFSGWVDENNDAFYEIPAYTIGDKVFYGEFESIEDRPARSLEFKIYDYELDDFVDADNATQTEYRKSSANRRLWAPENTDTTRFDGWYLNAGFTGTKYAAIPAGTDENLVYYGRWTEPEGYGKKMGRTKAEDFVLNAGPNEVKLSDFYGKKPVVLNFWSSKCDPCKAEMPHFQEVFVDANYSDSGEKVAFLMINSMALSDTPEAAQKYITDNGFTFGWHHDTNRKIANAYGVSSYPTTVMVDKWGYISYKFVGTVSKATLQAEITKAKKVS